MTMSIERRIDFLKGYLQKFIELAINIIPIVPPILFP